MHRIRSQARIRRFATVAAMVLTWGMASRAQATLTGKWQGETNNGAAIVLDLAVDGTALTGTLSRNGESTPIAEGKVSKNTFTFKATLGGQAEQVSGELADDHVKVWLDRQGPEMAIVLSRVKSAAKD